MPDTEPITPKPRYVIINDCDAPQPDMVCQWVPGRGYCYLDRTGTKPRHDSMKGAEATPVEDFGLVWAENADGTVTFYKTDKPSTATYRDGMPRQWQSHCESFEHKRMRKADA